MPIHATPYVWMDGAPARRRVASVHVKPLVRANRRGPLTARSQERFFGFFTGETEDRWNRPHKMRAEEKEKRHAHG